jgi:hypothetical protein
MRDSADDHTIATRLDFLGAFQLYGNVPADDQVTSLNATDGSIQNNALAFTTTHWSVVLEAQGDSPAAQERKLHVNATKKNQLFHRHWYQSADCLGTKSGAIQANFREVRPFRHAARER